MIKCNSAITSVICLGLQLYRAPFLSRRAVACFGVGQTTEVTVDICDKRTITLHRAHIFPYRFVENSILFEIIEALKTNAFIHIWLISTNRKFHQVSSFFDE